MIMNKKSSSLMLPDEKSKVDLKIREQFKQLQLIVTRTEDAIDLIKEKYPYLEFESIRKIIYGLIIPAP